ncbi:hypothetical protein [Bosea caraganae]|nr:hypothetical protein [Bosea caraganae]
MRRLAALCCLVLLSASASAADELSARICPILEKAAKEGKGKDSVMAQYGLLMAVGGAYDFKPEPLKAVLANVDAATTAACPEARAAVLKLVARETLAQALR